MVLTQAPPQAPPLRNVAPIPRADVVLYAQAVTETARPRIRVVVAMRNCEAYVAHSMRSLLQQKVPFRAIVIDDVSTDGTYQIARQTVGFDSRVQLVRNAERVGALANIIRGIDSLQTEVDDVVVTLDGDDWFASEDALGYIQSTYQKNRDLRLTYGQFTHSSTGVLGFCAAYPGSVVSARSYRKYTWLASHLRTFRVELWKKIRQGDLLDPQTRRPWMMAWDLAMMFPMLEMCRPSEAKFLPQVLYVYNDGNPLNDNRVNPKYQRDLEARIRSMPAYSVTPR